MYHIRYICIYRAASSSPRPRPSSATICHSLNVSNAQRIYIALQDAPRVHPTPQPLHPAPCTLHPYTLHRNPYTLHPTPQPLHLTPNT